MQYFTKIIYTYTTSLNCRPCPQTDLYVSAASHLREVLVLLQGFIHLVVGHAVAAQAALAQLIHFCKHHKLGHVRDGRQLPVEQVGEGHGLGCPRAVCEPETGGEQSQRCTCICSLPLYNHSQATCCNGCRCQRLRTTYSFAMYMFALNLPCWNIGCETGTIIGIDKLSSASNVLPLSWGGATWEPHGERAHWVTKKLYWWQSFNNITKTS